MVSGYRETLNTTPAQARALLVRGEGIAPIEPEAEDGPGHAASQVGGRGIHAQGAESDKHAPIQDELGDADDQETPALADQ